LHAPGVCLADGCLDEALLTGLGQRLAALPAERRERGVLLVLHQMGSHGPAYYKRSPAALKPFQPECTSSALQDCERQAVINAYDNSIAYTDRVLAGAIDWLSGQSKQYDPLLLYVSDHGESLGEGGLYLHGLPFMFAPSEQTRVPMLIWLSAGFDADRGLDRVCLAQRRTETRSHDDLFHSVLGLFDVKSRIYEPALDLFRPCRGEHSGVLSRR
jgi:lipid A ethanolaminephosphotransferase